MTAILFFAHGSRDPQWRVPFDAILADFRGMHATKLAELAFLEFMQPEFAGSVTALIEAAQQTHAGIRFTVASPIGEVDSIRSAISSWVATQL